MPLLLECCTKQTWHPIQLMAILSMKNTALHDFHFKTSIQFWFFFIYCIFWHPSLFLSLCFLLYRVLLPLNVFLYLLWLHMLTSTLCPQYPILRSEGLTLHGWLWAGFSFARTFLLIGGPFSNLQTFLWLWAFSRGVGLAHVLRLLWRRCSSFYVHCLTRPESI